jgi:hypothetical protein
VGGRLTCRPAAFTAATRVATRWLRGSTPIPRATRAVYRPTRADRGGILACRSTATGPGGTSQALSLGVIIRAAPAPRRGR